MAVSVRETVGLPRGQDMRFASDESGAWGKQVAGLLKALRWPRVPAVVAVHWAALLR